jgi:hypothetical protein
MDRGVNDHDLERILSDYADSVELKSLLVTRLLAIRRARFEASPRSARPLPRGSPPSPI